MSMSAGKMVTKWCRYPQAEEFPALGPTPTRPGMASGEGGLHDVSLCSDHNLVMNRVSRFATSSCQACRKLSSISGPVCSIKLWLLLCGYMTIEATGLGPKP